MKSLKQLGVAVAIACSMAIVTPAAAAGKIENATAAQVKEAAAGALSHSEEALASLKNGSSNDAVLDHIQKARQESKRIEVGRLDPMRNKGMSKLTDARAALAKNQNAEAEALLVAAVKIYKEIKESF